MYITIVIFYAHHKSVEKLIWSTLNRSDRPIHIPTPNMKDRIDSISIDTWLIMIDLI